MQLTKQRKLRLQPHHIAWLQCHPGRTAEWLAERLADNFHVHHVDGDHDNDAPKNLVLIEGLDHMLLFHGMENYSPNSVAGKLGAIARSRMPKKKWSAICRKGAKKRWRRYRAAKREAARAVAAASRAKRQGESHKRANEARAT